MTMKFDECRRILGAALLSLLLSACATQSTTTPMPALPPLHPSTPAQPQAPSEPPAAAVPYPLAPPVEAPSDTTIQPLPTLPPPIVSPEPAPVRPESLGPASRNPAVVALLTEADNLSRARQLDAASATLERALRLDPRNAQLWYRLAKLRLDQRRPEQAQSLAYKSISLAGRDARLLQLNWLLIAQAKIQLGDANGAEQARARAQGIQP